MKNVLTRIAQLIDDSSVVRSYAPRCPDDTADHEKTLKRLCKRRFVKTFERSYVLQILSSSTSASDVTDEDQIAAEELRATKVAAQVEEDLKSQRDLLVRANDELEEILRQIEINDSAWRGELATLKIEFGEISSDIFSPDPNCSLLDAKTMEDLNSKLGDLQAVEAKIIKQIEGLEASELAEARRTADLLPAFNRLLMRELFVRRIEATDAMEDLVEHFGFLFDNCQPNDNVEELMAAIEAQGREIKTSLENEISLLDAIAFLRPSGTDVAEVKGQKKLAVTFACPTRSPLFHVTRDASAPSNFTPKEIILVWDDQRHFFSDLLFRVGHKKSGVDLARLEEAMKNWKKSLGVGSSLAVPRISIFPLFLGQ